MYCSTCGWQAPETNKFCNACGARLETAAATPGSPASHATAPAYPVAPRYPTAPMLTPGYRPAYAPVIAPDSRAVPAARRCRGARTLAIVLLTVLLTLGVVLGVGYWTWSSPPTVDAGIVETVVIGTGE